MLFFKLAYIFCVSLLVGVDSLKNSDILSLKSFILLTKLTLFVIVLIFVFPIISLKIFSSTLFLLPSKNFKACIL